MILMISRHGGKYCVISNASKFSFLKKRMRLLIISEKLFYNELLTGNSTKLLAINHWLMKVIKKILNASKLRLEA